MELASISMPEQENTQEIIDHAVKLYRKWVSEGKHYEIESVYCPINEPRNFTQLKTIYLNEEEMVKLYQTLGDWMENECTGSTFNFPRFESEIDSFAYDWYYNEFFKINEHLDYSFVEDCFEDITEIRMDFIDTILSEIIGKINTNFLVK